MKYFFLTLSLFLTVNAFGQKKIELKFFTAGVCNMCEARIETALLDLNGVWTAEWNVKTHETFVVYRPKRISEEQIHQAISNAGHDQICSCEKEKILAPDKIYENIHNCCKYRDPNVIEAHK